jgi:Skp family chaperone for outer membrane proteins
MRNFTMKKSVMAAAAAFAIVAASTGGLVSAAQAQGEAKAPIILIVDQAQVVSTSKAGKAMRPQMAALEEAANKDLNAEVAKVVKEGEDLQKQKGLMAEDVWTQKAQQIAVKQNNLPAMREVKLRELQISEQKALGKINDAMLPILKTIVDSRGATILLDRSAVMYASTDIDITQQVIAELDKKLTTVTVEKTNMAELQKQAAEAQKKAAAAAPKKK